MKQNTFLTFKAAASPRKGLLPNQLQPKNRSQASAQNPVPERSARVDGRTHFYMECDVMLIVYVGASWAQWRESL